MTDPQAIIDDLLKGHSYLSYLNSLDITKRSGGCTICGKTTKELLHIIIALQDQVDFEIFDETTEGLYQQMMRIIDTGEILVLPKVNAGPDVSIQLPNDNGVTSASVVQGTYPIATYLWEVISGNTVALGTPNALNTTFVVMEPGVTYLRLTVTDSNGNSNYDSFKLTAIAVPVNPSVAFYMFLDTYELPDELDILNAANIAINSGSPYVVPVVNIQVKFVLVAEYKIEPIKKNWRDIVDSENSGKIGLVGYTFGPILETNQLRVYLTEFKTKFPNPIELY